jgi:DNA-binding CsgD family transcriptional regulator/tetratricopeptide (TPR) repeat protein
MRSCLDEAWSGASTVLVIEGDPGIGKSTMLADARAAAPGTVLSTTGIEGESDIAYGNLADVFRGHYAHLAAIPERQADALASVFAIGPSRPADRFTVASATLNLFGAIAAEGPLLVTIDDAQWIDPASFQALLFAANRLDVNGVALLFAVRARQPAGQQLSRFPTLVLDGLRASDARQLLAEAGAPAMSEASMARLVEESGGNPLALLTLPTTMPADDLALWALSAEPLPIGSVLEDAFRGNITTLPPETRQALVMLAVLGSGTAKHTSVWSAAELSLDDLDPAEEAGLIVYRQGRPEFRHPLIRAAAYRVATSAARRRAHLHAADLLQSSTSARALERRAGHLVAAGTAADESLAATFEATADQELATGNFTVAGKLYQRSADLTPNPNIAMRRMLSAANALRLAGAIDESRGLLTDAASRGDDPDLLAAIGYALSRLEVYRGSMVQGRDGLLEVGMAAAARNPVQAADILSDAALASTVIGDMETARRSARHAIALVAHPESNPPLQVTAVRAMVSALSGDPGEARALLAPRTAEIDTVDPLGIDFVYQVTLELSLAHFAIEEADRARVLLERAVEGARARSATGVLPFRLGSLARVQFWQGRWATALATVHEALRLAEETGWVSERPSSLATLARIEAVTGHHEECRRHAREATAAAELAGAGTYAALGQAACGLLELTRQNPAAAIAHFELVTAFADNVGFARSPVMWWSSDLIECYVAEGMFDAARHELAKLEAAATGPAMPITAAVAARCRALLEPAAFERHMADAVRLHAVGDMPFEQARTELLIGGYLRRHNQSGKARSLLASALATFERLRAVDWANRARDQLEATGMRIRRTTDGLGELTPQELQVALAVTRGMSNKEIAGHLFLSVKTVEFHLSHVFHKLGVNRRTQVAGLVARHETWHGTSAAENR